MTQEFKPFIYACYKNTPAEDDIYQFISDNKPLIEKVQGYTTLLGALLQRQKANQIQELKGVMISNGPFDWAYDGFSTSPPQAAAQILKNVLGDNFPIILYRVDGNELRNDILPNTNIWEVPISNLNFSQPEKLEKFLQFCQTQYDPKQNQFNQGRLPQA